MYVELTKNNGIPYLRLVKGIRRPNKDGVMTVTKKTVLNIGPLSRYDDGKPDYVQRLKESFRNGHPLIEELLPYVEEQPEKKYDLQIVAGSAYCRAAPKRFAPCILDPVFSALGLDELFASIKHASGLQYDLQGIVRLLTYSRLLEPASKQATMRQNELYYRPPVKSSNDSNVYDALDMIYANRRQIFQRMNTCITRGIGRNAGTLYYDVTNFFFETDEPDEDVQDEDGTVIAKGLRKMGVSKENRKQPIVQVGLFLDDNGIPVSMEMFPGNTLDHLTLRSAMSDSVDNMNLGKFILIADRGMYSGTNMCHVTDRNNGYIVSKSLKKSTKEEREWVLDRDGYTVVNSDFRYKSRIVTRTITAEDGSKKKIRQKVVVYWSSRFYARELHENRSFLDFIEKLKANPTGFRVSAGQSRSLRKFMKKELLQKETGEIVDSRKLFSMIDEEKLTEFNELMGYYQIVSSELDMDDREIIDKYHGLTRIEDQFREMKGTLETRPVWVYTPEHIQAHLMICFIALTMIRVIQHKIGIANPGNDPDCLNWSYGLPGERLTKALRDWKVEQLSADYFRMVDADSEDLIRILNAFGVTLPLDLFTRGQLRAMTSDFKVF